MNIRPTTVPAGQLLEHIAKLLVKRPYEAPELARLTGFSVVTIGIRLKVLEQDGRAHRVRAADLEGLRYRWFTGPAPACRVHLMKDDEPRTVTISRCKIARDWAVAALFGPAPSAGLLGGILSGEG